MAPLLKRICSEDWTPIGVDDLEDNAWKVVQSTNHQSVTAGPGAGKTELLAQRAIYLFQTGLVPTPRRILAISFKRDAATNLAARVRERCHGRYTNRFDSMTFDAFAKGLVDRFGQTLPSQWCPRPDYKVILNDDTRLFDSQHLLGSNIPLEGWKTSTPEQQAADHFWQSHLHSQAKTRLSFAMIGRLAELLIRVNVMASRALRLTYSHLFMDEFQDTTQIQYDLVQSIFLNSDTLITAVGDNKQKIMRWAGAMNDPFSMLESDFGAQRTVLSNNYRSSPKLVKIQNMLAQTLDKKAIKSVSKEKATIIENECSIWNCSTPEIEAKRLTEFISDDMIENSLQPRDFVILVRQKAVDYARILEPIFEDANLPIRNESEMIDGITIQNLLTEEFSKFLITILRMAMAPRAGLCWSKCQNTLSTLRGINLDNEGMRIMVTRELDKFATYLQSNHSKPPETECAAHAIVKCVLNFIGRDRLIATHSAYAQGDWFKKIIAAAAIHLHTSSANTNDWIEAIDAYEGLHAIPLMTIHKSKGLEYHTVIFIGLDDDAWWNFPKNETEGIASFFVAFSRAKQRVIFTYCANRGARKKIARLYDLLQQAHVPVIDMH